MGVQYTKKTWPCLSFEYVFDMVFWINLARRCRVRPNPVYLPLTYKKNQLYTSSLYFNFETLNFQEFFTIRSISMPDMEFGMGS